MDKNLLLAVSLSIAVYALWFGFIEKRVAPIPGVPRAAASAGASAPAPSSSAASAPSPEQRRQREEESEKIELGPAEVLLHPRGAALVSYRYQEPLGVVELVPDPQPGFFATLPELTFQRDAAASGIVYTARRPDGVRVSKEFIAEAEGRLPRLRLTMTNPGRRDVQTGAWTLSVGPGLGTVASEQKENQKVWRALGFLPGERGLQGKVDVFKPGEHAGPYRWVGVDNRFFLAAVLPAPGDFSSVESRLPPEVALSAQSVTLAPGASRTWEIPYYLGSKGHNWLSHYRVDLERSIDFGFFAQLGRFILRVLNRLHGLTGNWGWSIILLTVMIQLALSPLTYKSLKATTMMRKLQPEIAKLQQKYGKDPTKLNAETMELYKKHGANPLGGCLPMLVQMPVFYALYTALRNSWELHGAVWIFWIRDLSAKDPFYVLPVVMGGLMFAQNKLNPAATDPTQAQMMTFMPLIFTFMFMNFPAGLVLYWLTNSLLSTLQQLALRNHFNQSPGRQTA